MTSAPLLLVTAGGLARETADAARESGFDVVGYLDDDESAWGSVRASAKVLAGLAAITDYPDARLTVCAGSGSDCASASMHRLAGLG